jgi:hypothetical protein
MTSLGDGELPSHMSLKKPVKIFQELLEDVAEERCGLPGVFKTQIKHGTLRVSSQFWVFRFPFAQCLGEGMNLLPWPRKPKANPTENIKKGFEIVEMITAQSW